MKKINYLLIMVLVFGVFSVVKAENVNVSDIISKFQSSGYEVTSKADGTSFVVNTGSETIEYTYSGADNTLSYSAGAGKEVTQVIQTDKVLGYIVDLSPNKSQYEVARSNSSVSSVSYGSGCDLANMGFCYDSASGKMQVVMSNQFTTYLYNYYSTNGVPGDAAKNSSDPLYTDEDANGTDSKNPETGAFTEIGLIVGLLALLLVVINLKRHSETEFKI